jgi:hypothetical protein
MTTNMLTPADRQRIEDRLDHLADLDRLMRQPGGLSEAPEPVPLHRSHGKTNVSTNERATTT